MNEKPLRERKAPLPIHLSRFLLVYLILGGVVLGMVVRLSQLQLFRSQEYRQQAEQQKMAFIELSPRRGDILDRHLDELAISVTIDSIFAHPREVVEPLLTARALASILGTHEQEIYEKLIGDRPFVYLARKVSPRQADRIRELKFKGIFFQQETKRVYPGRALAGHVLGFVGVDNEGLAGLEYLYDDFIKGKKTRVHLRVDGKRHSYQSEGRAGETDGNTIVLNLDRPIQHATQQVLSKELRARNALSGSAIVMNPYSGEILAMASFPDFNPNRYGVAPPAARRNRAILDIYEPGSTFKIIPFSGVLNEGLGDPSEMVDCKVETLTLGGKHYREAVRSFGVLSFNEVLAKSSNVGTIKLALRLQPEGLYDYIRRFGFGRKTGVDLPGEQAGLLRPPSQWSAISIGAHSIGQELGATPLQMVTAVSAVANGGFIVSPRVVQRILTPEGEVVYEPEVQRQRILRDDTTRRMKNALALVVNQGTGRGARLNGYSSGGKTGTAQKFVDGRYSDTRFVASYLGFAPLDNPALAAIVVVNEPQGAYHGGQVAAPIFKQIMERALIHLGVQQDQPAQPADPHNEPVRLELTATDGVPLEETQLEPERLEETVLSLMKAGSAGGGLRKEIAVVTSEVVFPDFTGMSLRQVARESARLGVRLKVAGNGRVVGQRPPPQSRVLKDMVCEVYLSNDASSRVTLTAGSPAVDRTN